MSLVIARDGKVYIVVNAEKLTSKEAMKLGDKIRAAALVAAAQQFGMILTDKNAKNLSNS